MSDPQVEKEEHAPAHAHEKTDANVKAVSLFALSLVVMVVVVGAVSAVYYYYLSKNWPHVGTATAPMPDPSQVPPAPQLQTSPQQDLKRMREYEEQRLRTAGWIDRQAGVTHIPIEQAMDLVAQRGLPWKATPAAPSPEIGVTITGPAGSAPRLRGR